MKSIHINYESAYSLPSQVKGAIAELTQRKINIISDYVFGDLLEVLEMAIIDFITDTKENNEIHKEILIPINFNTDYEEIELYFKVELDNTTPENQISVIDYNILEVIRED